MSSILKVDTIDEVTSANGVTVDGLSIKDSKLVTADSVVTTNITDANVTTAKIADVNVTEGKIADNAITLAKMASGTDGNIISYDAAGNPVAVSTGSAGQVLTSAGAGSPPTFAAAAAGGKLLQVVTTTKSDVFTSNTNSFVDVTGMSVSITPSASSSKIMIICNLLIGGQDGSLYAWKLLRGSTEISVGDAAGSRTRATLFGQHTGSSYINVSNSITFLDSPSTTSSTTYKIQGRAETTGGQLITVNANADDGNSANIGRGASTITVMEIGA